MLVAVFLMQSVGRLLAYLIGICALVGISHNQKLDLTDLEGTRLIIDMWWRTVIGVGVFPAAVALLLRLTIPETPRFDSDIKDDLRQAVESAADVYRPGPRRVQDITPAGAVPAIQTPTGLRWFDSAGSYLFGRNGMWKHLFTISFLWLMLDICLYGLSFDSPNLLSRFWIDQPQTGTLPGVCDPSNPDNVWKSYPDTDIYGTLMNNMIRGIEVSAIPALAGSVVALLLINRWTRADLFMWTSVALAVVFLIAGTSFIAAYAQPTHWVTVVFYAISEFLLNVGPNTLTFVLAAEIFPTVYRGTFYGVAGATGKLGAVIIQVIINVATLSKDTLVVVLCIFFPVMIASAVISKIALPSVQGERSSLHTTYRQLPNSSHNCATEGEESRRRWWELLFPAELDNLSLEGIRGNNLEAVTD